MRVRIGAIGPGQRLIKVLRGLLADERRLELVALADPSVDSLERAEAELGLAGSLRREEAAVYADPSIDWVFIGSPNGCHAAQMRSAFEAGKHVFCEKPLALSLDELPPVVEAWRRSGCLFALGLVLRYAKIYRKLSELVHGGAIGSLLSFEFNETLSPAHGGYIHGNWRRHRAEAGTHLLEKCCHDLDLCLWLTGSRPRRAASFGGLDFFRPENRETAMAIPSDESDRPLYQSWPDPMGVDPFLADKDIIDNQVAILEMESGVRATFHTNCNAALQERRFYLIGSEGAIRADALTGLIEVHFTDPKKSPQRIDVDARGSHAGADAIMSQGLRRTLLEGEAPAAGMHEGIASLVTACGIDQAMDTGCVVDFAPLWARAGHLGKETTLTVTASTK